MSTVADSATAPTVDSMIAEARRLARTRGAADVSARDVRDAADRHISKGVQGLGPAAQLPEHYEQALTDAECVHEAVRKLSRGGIRSPRVLVVGETSGVVAGWFIKAGADAATCDIQPTKTPHIPHYQGDASDIQDEGWDLVVAHPPCTYLAQSGLMWLLRNPGRWNDMVNNAAVFRRMRAARAPFVALENSKMHRYGKALVGGDSPSQYVHPWQHGTGHTKPTALYLNNLPPLRPTHEVSGREHALARLPPSAERAEMRSRTYEGIAAAMAIQWTPILVEYARQSPSTRRDESAATTIAKASVPRSSSCHVAFVRRGAHQVQVATLALPSHAPALPSRVIQTDSSPVDALRQWTQEHDIPPLWVRALDVAASVYVTGHHTVTAAGHSTHLWVVDVTELPIAAMPYVNTWVEPRLLNGGPHLDKELTRYYRSLVNVSASIVMPRQPPPMLTVAVSTEKAPTAYDRRPWLVDATDLPPPPPTPRHIRRIRNRWCVWDVSTSRADLHCPYSWQPLPTSLQTSLDQHLSLPSKPMTTILETADTPLQHATSAIQEATRTVTEIELIAAIEAIRKWRPYPVAAVTAHHDLARLDARALWDVKPPLPHLPRLGLGADPDTPPPAKAPLARGPARAEAYRKAHQQWCPAGHVHATEPKAARPVALVESDAFTTTPRQLTDFQHALRTELLRIIRDPVGRNANRPRQMHDPRRYDVSLFHTISRALIDTGAGPSVITTELLAALPKDCCVFRDTEDHGPPLTSADGRPLRQAGSARVFFLLGDTPCRHDFYVVEGAPLLLIGNDFMVPRRAQVQLNDDGSGLVSFTSPLPSGKSVSHSVAVTTQPFESPPARSVSLADYTGDTQSTDVDDTGGTADPLPTATTPEAMGKDAIAAGAWELQSSEHLLYSHRPIKLPPRSTVTVWLKCPLELAERAVSCLVDRLPNRVGLEQPPQVIPRPTSIVDGYIAVAIMHTGRKTHTIAANIPVCLLDSEYYVHRPPPTTEPAAGDKVDSYARLTGEEKAVVDAVTIDPDERLTLDQREEVRQLVSRHVTAFALDSKNPTKTHLMEVELPLKPGATPHRHGASRLGEAGRTIVEKHCEEMESRGIIRKSNSDWGSRVVLVSKKDGSVRFCVDFRDLNSKLQLQDSPLPLTVEAIDRLASGKGPMSSLFLSTLDLASGFWCLPIKESDKGLTAFVTHRQKYEFNYLPFGIQSGPSYMCRLMDAALQGLAWETCMPYLDDVGIWSTGTGQTAEEREQSSFQQMLVRLEAVFERLKWAGLSMKASKCTLFATSAEYLGHVMSREGLRMDPKKIAAVKDIDPTSISSLHRVRSFLGLCSYYRKFIKSFSQIASPLHDLTKDGVDVENQSQNAECQAAIRRLIESITTEPVLATPRFDRPFIVKTDAANTEGLGGVLVQRDDDGHERVIAYYGRKLNKHERNYTVTEIELLAALESIRNWRPYLWGRKFSLIIDHAALKWLHTMRDTMEGGPASRLMRWILKLQEYDFTVEHKPGVNHCDADGVSRLVALAEKMGQTEYDFAKELATDLNATGTTSTPSATPLTVARAEVPTARRVQAAQRPVTTRTEILRSHLSEGGPSEDTIRDEQREDAECIAIKEYLSTGRTAAVTDNRTLLSAAWLAREASPDADGTARMEVDDDILFRRLTPTLRVPFVPQSLRQLLLTAYHDQLGHIPRDRILPLLRSGYYWPAMHRDVDHHVSACHECTLGKPPSSRPRQPVGPTVGRYPFDVVYADILDMADTHDYDKEKGTGARKLVVFMDSLSRWVEAVPLHKDPTSEQILDIFIEHVVSRHGSPRRLITDAGSNLASHLCDAVHASTGVDLRPAAAEHHETVGIVERFNKTLANMARASDEGGRYWADHLPFLLMAYRATPNRTTKLSPAELLYGRKLRLPPQMHWADQPASADGVFDGSDDAAQGYADRLNRRCVYAWNAALQLTRETQGDVVADTWRKSAREHLSFKVDDRVARRLYGPANKLQNVYAGPYRVTEVLGDGRYRLTDLENNHVKDEIDVSNLRPYRTFTDANPLQPDEYLVDELMTHRDRGTVRTYKVKWRGYPRTQGTWVLRTELERRCAELLTAYEARHPLGTPRRAAAPPSITPAVTDLPPPTTDSTVTVHPAGPSEAELL